MAFHRVCLMVMMAAACGGRAGPTNATANTPPARWLAGMVFDDSQHRVLLFGGMSGPPTATTLPVRNDLWAWDGQRWTQLGTGGGGPPARADMLLAWDSARRRLVVYGGVGANDLLGDTWEWDGTSWSERATVGPPLRRHFGGGYDLERGRTVLFGGLVGDTPAVDTWEWDGQQWTQRATTIPPGGFTAPAREMAYSVARKSLLMLVGSFSSAPAALWQWNGATWSSVAIGPTHAMPIPMSVSGADEITALASDGRTFRWRGGEAGFSVVGTTGPGARDGASLTFDRTHDRLVLFGGLSGQRTAGDTWLWDGTAWSSITP